MACIFLFEISLTLIGIFKVLIDSICFKTQISHQLLLKINQLLFIKQSKNELLMIIHLIGEIERRN